VNRPWIAAGIIFYFLFSLGKNSTFHKMIKKNFSPLQRGICYACNYRIKHGLSLDKKRGRPRRDENDASKPKAPKAPAAPKVPGTTSTRGRKPKGMLNCLVFTISATIYLIHRQLFEIIGSRSVVYLNSPIVPMFFKLLLFDNSCFCLRIKVFWSANSFPVIRAADGTTAKRKRAQQTEDDNEAEYDPQAGPAKPQKKRVKIT
jgi:hypothetical protein